MTGICIVNTKESKCFYRRALGIIENEFVETLVEEQDILGTGHKVKKLVERLPEDLANKDLLGKLMDLPTSLDRWKCLVNHVKQFQEVRNRSR